jgi:4-hydroxybenzoate polyprenyltransferase
MAWTGFLVVARALPPGLENVALASVLGACVGTFGLGIFTSIQELQVSAKNGSETMPLYPVEHLSFSRRLMLAASLLYLLVSLSLGWPLTPIIYFVSPIPYWIVAAYWATELRPRRKSKIRQGIEWLKGVLTPGSNPVPVGN